MVEVLAGITLHQLVPALLGEGLANTAAAVKLVLQVHLQLGEISRLAGSRVREVGRILLRGGGGRVRGGGETRGVQPGREAGRGPGGSGVCSRAGPSRADGEAGGRPERAEGEGRGQGAARGKQDCNRGLGECHTGTADNWGRGTNAALNSQRPERSEEGGQQTSATLSLLHWPGPATTLDHLNAKMGGDQEIQVAILWDHLPFFSNQIKQLRNCVHRF